MDPAAAVHEPTPAPPDVIVNLQLLRGIAAAMIVVLHVLRQFWGKPAVVASLFAGVDIFFVISGFIMVFVTERRLQSPSAFLVDRAIRIIPIYWTFTLLLAAAQSTLPGLNTAAPTGAELVKSLLFVPYGAPPNYPPILFVGWSLNAEVVFYLLFALSLAVAPGNARRWLVTAAGVAAVYLLAHLAPQGSGLRFYGQSIVLEFILGMALAYWRSAVRRIPAPLALALVIAGAAAIAALPAFVRAESTFLLFGVPGAAIVAGLIALEAHGRVAPRALAVWGGAISYILYLTHPLVISAFGAVQAHIALLKTPGGTVATALSALAAAFVFARLPTACSKSRCHAG
ncbi:acyltransferase family protein [Parablastomonas sp. CN1-191]|uniref:acyltransferase family protein n=1 Tax=Parablastomonas sp. CN1-191 TaxID=3400908 RepID=UPI003BF7CD09